MRRILFLLLSLATGNPSTYGQAVVSYDYAIRSIELFNILPDSGEKVRIHDLGAYMYDIGPAPVFQFQVEIEQYKNPSIAANYAKLEVEQYMLLVSRTNHSFVNVDSLYKEAVLTEPTWVYHSPVSMSFSCESLSSIVRCISSSNSPLFMNPDHPLSYASPHAYQLLGFAYRFVLVPAHARARDTNQQNNSFQVTFMKR